MDDTRFPSRQSGPLRSDLITSFLSVLHQNVPNYAHYRASFLYAPSVFCLLRHCHKFFYALMAKNIVASVAPVLIFIVLAYQRKNMCFVSGSINVQKSLRVYTPQNISRTWPRSWAFAFTQAGAAWKGGGGLDFRHNCIRQNLLFSYVLYFCAIADISKMGA